MAHGKDGVCRVLWIRTHGKHFNFAVCLRSRHTAKYLCPHTYAVPTAIHHTHNSHLAATPARRAATRPAAGRPSRSPLRHPAPSPPRRPPRVAQATPRRPATSRPQGPSPTAPASGSARACAGAGALQLGHKPTRVADAVTPARAAGADAASPPPALHGSKRFAVLSCSTAAPHGSGGRRLILAELGAGRCIHEQRYVSGHPWAARWNDKDNWY